MIAGLLLAAGYSRRFGADKLAATLDGKAVIRWSAMALSSLDAVYVVIPPGADALAQALSGLDVTFVINPGRDEGMSSSIRLGMAALPLEVTAVMIALADQPRVAPATVTALCSRWRARDVAAVAPVYRDGRGHPVLFGRDCFGALTSLKGDVGARAILDGLGDGVAYVDVDALTPVDVDTPELLAGMQGVSS